MKRKMLIITLILSVLLLTSCKGKETISDSKKFASEYTQVQEYNVFTYRSEDEIIKILEHGTGIVYLGFPECPWCQAYVPILNEVADIEGLDKVYYYNILKDRQDNTEVYQKLVSILSDNLRYDEEGNKRIYVPAVISVVEGKITGFDDESSYDTLGFNDSKDYWTEERIKNLKLKLTNMISPVVENKCSECNK